MVRDESTMSGYSSGSSFTLATPLAAPRMFFAHDQERHKMHIDEEMEEMAMEEDEEEMMMVDEMVERVGHLAV
jgi:hypothetical protein